MSWNCQRWQSAGAGDFQESKNKETSLLVKVHICPTKFLLTNKNQPANKNACDTDDFIISYDTTMIVFFFRIYDSTIGRTYQPTRIV